LIFDHSGKVNKNKRHIRLVMHRKEPAVLGKVINKKYIIAVAINRRNQRWTPNISIQIFKRSMTRMGSDTKRQFMLLIALTQNT
jgi:hypothetical protein